MAGRQQENGSHEISPAGGHCTPAEGGKTKMDDIKNISVEFIRLLQKFIHEGELHKEEYEEIIKKFEVLVL